VINQIIGRAGVLRDVGSDGFIRDENNVLMKGPKGGFLAVSKDGQFVLDLDMAQLRVHESGSVPQEAAIFRIAAGPTANVGRVVDLAGNRFPDTPSTITDLKTGQTVEESQVRATAAASGGATQNYLILAGIALVAYMAMRRRR
jgi:hypothetical protein